MTNRHVAVVFVVVSALFLALPGAFAQDATPPTGIDPAAYDALLRALEHNQGSSWREWTQAMAVPMAMVFGPALTALIAAGAKWKPSISLQTDAPITVQIDSEVKTALLEAIKIVPALARMQERVEIVHDEIEKLREVRHETANELARVGLRQDEIEARLDARTVSRR